VKKNNLLQSAIVALLVANPLAAFADSQYPATDFEPKVLYQDESVKLATSNVKAAPVAVTPAPVSADDSKYPATNFQPKVIYQDANYKHDKNAPSLAPISSNEATSYSTSAGTVVMEKASESKEGDSNLFIMLALAAAVGFVAMRGRNCPLFGGQSNEDNAPANRETGVTRYLNARIPKVSGVTKYLERTGQPTNVARYIAKQNIAQKAAAQDNADRG